MPGNLGDPVCPGQVGGAVHRSLGVGEHALWPAVGALDEHVAPADRDIFRCGVAVDPHSRYRWSRRWSRAHVLSVAPLWARAALWCRRDGRSGCRWTRTASCPGADTGDLLPGGAGGRAATILLGVVEGVGRACRLLARRSNWLLVGSTLGSLGWQQGPDVGGAGQAPSEAVEAGYLLGESRTCRIVGRPPSSQTEVSPYPNCSTKPPLL
jgi:hypothetical protein